MLHGRAKIILHPNSLPIYSSSSIGLVEMASLWGLCFFHFSFGKDMIQGGTSQPDAAITLAMFRKYGTSASVYRVTASPLLPALPERPIRKTTNQGITEDEQINCRLTRKVNNPANHASIIIQAAGTSRSSHSPILWIYAADESGKS